MGNHKPDLLCSFHISNSHSIIKRGLLACLQLQEQSKALSKALETVGIFFSTQEDNPGVSVPLMMEDNEIL